MQISKIDLKKTLEKHIHEQLDRSQYEVSRVESNELLKFYTFDLAFKLYYLDYKNINLRLAREVYFSHIKAYNFFKIKEYGNLKKKTLKDFENYFTETFENIRTNGFDLNKSIIPLTKNGDYLNGSHRVSVCINLKKKVFVLNTGLSAYSPTDYSFFYKKAVQINVIEKALKNYLEYLDGVYIAFIWPSAYGNTSKINKIIKNKIYYKEIKLNSIGAHNLLAEVYKDQNWIGNSKNNYKGTIGKLKECFKDFNRPLRLIVFQERSHSDVIKIKDKIRNIFKIGKHSIHITDTKNEMLELSKIVFNKNGIHFLNNARPFKYKSSELKLINFKKYLFQKKVDLNKVVIYGSFVMEVYGIRKARDIDFLNIQNKSKNSKLVNKTILENSKLELADLVYDDNNFFEFYGLKFVSFHETYKIKKMRNEKKDIRDLRLMKSYLKNDLLTVIRIRFNQYVYFMSIFIKVKIIEFLKIIKIHSVVKKIYNSVLNFFK